MEESEIKKPKMKFFKKIWYSIAKVSKYDEMIEQGPKKAIKYFLGLIAILSIILTIVAMGVEIFTVETIETSLYAYYAIIYYLSHFIVLFIIYALYIFIIAMSIFLVSKLFKMGQSVKNSLSMTIYASTLSIIVYVVYLVISYFTKIAISYFDSIAILFVFIYIGIIFNRKRKERPNVVYRSSKK
jgi:cation transport ATPase